MNPHAAQRRAGGLRSPCPGCRPWPCRSSPAAARAVRTPEQSGWSHLLEHMVFKGAGSPLGARHRRGHRGARRAHLNAATGYERTSFQVRALAGGLDLGLAVIADLIAAPDHDRRRPQAREKHRWSARRSPRPPIPPTTWCSNWPRALRLRRPAAGPTDPGDGEVDRDGHAGGPRPTGAPRSMRRPPDGQRRRRGRRGRSCWPGRARLRRMPATNAGPGDRRAGSLHRRPPGRCEEAGAGASGAAAAGGRRARSRTISPCACFTEASAAACRRGCSRKRARSAGPGLCHRRLCRHLCRRRRAGRLCRLRGGKDAVELAEVTAGEIPTLAEPDRARPNWPAPRPSSKAAMFMGRESAAGARRACRRPGAAVRPRPGPGRGGRRGRRRDPGPARRAYWPHPGWPQVGRGDPGAEGGAGRGGAVRPGAVRLEAGASPGT
jgi:hypothetical protein